MRHGKKINHLGRTASHRKAMLSNMASSLIINKRITTTVAKAKALRQYVEPLITRSKTDTMHSRQMVFSYLQNKHSVKELFGEVSDRVAERPGGYTRILKLGNRRGDNAEMALIELVDFNEFITAEEETRKAKRTRRSRRSRGKSKSSEGTAQATATEQVAEDAPTTEEADTTEETKGAAGAASEDTSAEPTNEGGTDGQSDDDAPDSEEKKS